MVLIVSFSGGPQETGPTVRPKNLPGKYFLLLLSMFAVQLTMVLRKKTDYCAYRLSGCVKSICSKASCSGVGVLRYSSSSREEGLQCLLRVAPYYLSPGKQKAPSLSCNRSASRRVATKLRFLGSKTLCSIFLRGSCKRHRGCFRHDPGEGVAVR